ncbi:MAG: YceI family protein [Verrucomicrobia subdivision 3 bacterium]|nr:YceI family protein [Limisphaerales bacterium]
MSNVFWSLGITITGFLLAGCSDPADNVPKSATTEPKPTAVSVAGGKEYVVRADSKIGFVGSKVTGSHKGGFTNFSGKFTVADGKIVGTPTVKIGMQSTWADNDRLTGHLKSPDFFDVAKYPVTTFAVTAIEPEGGQQKITGNLELHGVTKSVSFPANVKIADDEVALKADFAINRKDFNINYPGKPDDLIRDNVVINLDLKATPGTARPEDSTVQ